MELDTAGTASRHRGGSFDSDDGVIEQRLAELLRLNSEIAHDEALYRDQRERIDAALITRPIDSQKVFSYFGLMIGSLPPFALVFKVIGETTEPSQIPMVFLILLTAAGIATGVVGYASGRYIPSIIIRVSNFSLPNRIALLMLTGFAWGAVSGAIGGLFLFIFGAIFASIAGGVIGAVSLPVMVNMHSALRRGDLIELKHFLPIALGITLTICALILGF